MARDKPLPHSVDAERAYLATLLMGEELVFKPNIKDFYFGTHKEVYSAMRKLNKAGKKIDLITVGEQLEDDGKLEAVGGNMFVIELCNATHYSWNQEEYYKIIKEKSVKRDIIKIGYDLQNTEDVSGMELLDRLSESKKELDKCGSLLVDETGGDMDGLLTNYLEFCGDNSKKKEGETIGYKTGIKLLDKYCDGIQPGTVTRISAYTNTGKTRFAMEILTNLLKQGVKCTFFSTEVMRKYFITNLISSYSKLSYNALKYGDTDVLRAIPMDEIKELPLDKFYDDKFTLDEIKFLSKKHSPQVLFIDFAQNIDCGKISDEYVNMTIYAREIQRFAIQNNIAVVDLSQISNASAKEQNSSFMGMKGSGALAASADVVVNLSKTETQPTTKGIVSLDIVIQKNKYGMKDIHHNLLVDFDKSIFNEFEF